MHALQCEVGYLFSGLWKAKGKGENGEQRDRQRDREERSHGCSYLFGRVKERKGLRLEAEDQPTLVDKGGSRWGLTLKGTGQIITFPSLFYNKKVRG